MLFTLSQTGVPMNCAIALPLILNHVHEQGFGHLLHSQQMYTPLATTLKVNGITPERNRLFMTKDYVNTLCRSIALTMRKGTGNFAKARKPEQVATRAAVCSGPLCDST